MESNARQTSTGYYSSEVMGQSARVYRLPLMVGRKRGTKVISPRKGFYKCARKLGVFPGDDALEFWANEVERLYKDWINH